MLTNGDLFAIIIALLGCLTVIGLFWKQNIELTKEVNRLRKELRKALKV
jgi:undecaprenyl pyrophosphate phosphatase UppP